MFTGGLAADTFGGSFTIEGKTVVLNGTSNTNASIATAIQQQTGLNYAVTGTGAAGTGLTFTNQKTGAAAGTTDFHEPDFHDRIGHDNDQPDRGRECSVP